MRPRNRIDPYRTIYSRKPEKVLIFKPAADGPFENHDGQPVSARNEQIRDIVFSGIEAVLFVSEEGSV